jgi:hypothetical protein
MIHYSAYPDLFKVITMFTTMNDEDKKYLYFNNEHFYIKLTELHYDIIKGRCLMLVDNSGETIGFVSISLEHNEQLFITELYIVPNKRAGSLPLLLEMFTHLKKFYLRPIRFVVHEDNKRMQRLAKFIKAEVVGAHNDRLEYLVKN